MHSIVGFGANEPENGRTVNPTTFSAIRFNPFIMSSVIKGFSIFSVYPSSPTKYFVVSSPSVSTSVNTPVIVISSVATSGLLVKSQRM